MRLEPRPRTGIRAPSDRTQGPDPTRRELRLREQAAQRGREPRFRRGVVAVAMLSVLGIAVATTVPAMALLTEDQVGARTASAHFTSAPASEGEVQALDSIAPAEHEAIVRDSTAATSGEQLAALRSMRIADTFRNNAAGAIQWPFPLGVPITSDFGPRTAPTAGASTNHLGVDFAPGAGVPIQIIAAGVVREVVTTDRGGCGVNVTIDHTIHGRLVSSKYCHMQTGSVRVAEGQQVNVADIVGTVGNTGISTGPHLHFEIRLDGTEPVDPLAWLKANAS